MSCSSSSVSGMIMCVSEVTKYGSKQMPIVCVCRLCVCRESARDDALLVCVQSRGKFGQVSVHVKKRRHNVFVYKKTCCRAVRTFCRSTLSRLGLSPSERKKQTKREMRCDAFACCKKKPNHAPWRHMAHGLMHFFSECAHSRTGTCVLEQQASVSSYHNRLPPMAPKAAASDP